ncbi:type II toxin-antitoxin system TacA family antitoxin [Microseira wollei]|uniref:DUF1778 domain-containing protein n=1 Tax=Microseira wollei NIES-4236 TaxID=2530354 RepID=A0AAV3XDI8_9CYAN|nr:DUF1778 domain-containing protein [Microseira wollei]GET39493.1 hypothetical protein N9414_12978 [Microseira wollei NIES-4236]
MSNARALQTVIEYVEALSPEEQDLLVELIHKRRVEKQRAEVAENIELTLSQQDKETLEKAAAAQTKSLSEYLLEVALNLAKETPEIEQIVLSDRDWEIFASALENPPEPNEALKAAIKEYQEEYGKW